MRDRRIGPNSFRSSESTVHSNGNHSRKQSTVIEAAIQNPEVFKACLEHARIGFSVINLEGQFLECSPAYCAITGYCEAELLAKRYPRHLTHPDDVPQTLERVRCLIAGEIRNFVLEKRYIRKNGEIVWVQNTVSLLRNPDGSPQKIVRLTQDITEQKLAEQSLRDLQVRNETILSNVSDVHILLDREWRYICVNDAAVESIGRSREEILGRTLWELYPDIRGTELEQAFLNAMDQRVPVTLDFHHQGTDTWWINRAYPAPEGLAVFATDITEHNRAIEALKKNEQEWADAQELANLGSWSWDINTGLMTWSDELYRILGLHPREIQASFAAIIARIHPEDRERVLEVVERCIKTKERYNLTNRVVRPDGSFRAFHVVGSVVTDEHDNSVRMFGIYHDITELEATKEARRDAEQKYREIIDNAGEGIFQSTPEGVYLMANPALARMHGFSSPDELMSSCKDISREIYVDPAQREKFKRLLERDGVVRDFEHETFRQDGARVWVSVNARAVRDDKGQILYYEGTAQDITESKLAEEALRESEERYRELFENSKDALYVHDMKGLYTSINRAAEKLSGYTREELIGKHFSVFLNPEYEAHVSGQLCKKLDDAAETTYEIEIVTKDGRQVPVEISSRLICANGLPVAVQGCVRDVSERRRVQAAARIYSRRLIEAQEGERRRMSVELHDQVGQILTAVKLNLHSLKQKCSSPEILASIEDNVIVIDEAADQVRDLSVDLRPLLLDDFGLVVALRWYLDRQAKNSGLEAQFVSHSLSEDTRFACELETACFRIVQEAVTNVVRHAKAKRVSVILEVSGPDVIVWISDDGTGFDLKVLRSGSATLGLRGMEERTQSLGGSISIDSAPQLGTEVCVRFPISYPQGRSYSASLSAAMS